MPDTSHLVVTVHGIRTYGNWQDELKDLLEAAEPGVTVLRYRYGFFSSLAFLIPPLRWLVARQFRNFMVQAVQSAPEGARIDLVAHSFGTYLAASALPYLPRGRKLNTVIFAGSVLRPSFPWYKYLQSRTVGRVVNECGWDDSVLVLCQSIALLMGMAGRIGFHGMMSDRFVNRYYRFGHGGYFDQQRQFMRERWVPLLTSDAAVPSHDERPPLTTLGGVKLFLLSNMQFIKVAVACLLLMTAVLIPVDWYHKFEYQKRVERLNHIALLTNAQEIPGRDPTHVRDLLKVDAKASGNEQAIDQMVGTESAEDVLEGEGRDDLAEPRWWDWLTRMSDSAREAYRARRAHALANHQLAAGKGDGDANKAKAQALYEAALSSYQRVNDYDPAHGSYALCLIDYGNLLNDLGAHDKAVAQYHKVREDVFPRDAKGQMSARPPSLAVDSLIFEAESLKALQKWADASDRLEEAVRIAEEQKDNALLSDARNASAWFHMERLEIERAIDDFEAAETACRDLVEGGRFVFQIRLFHIRHGRALADRLKGQASEAYDQYEQIVRELQELMRNDLKFTPKQRHDLRDRLINSMERRADVMLFASQAPAASTADDDGVESGSHAKARAATSEHPASRVVDDFQEAIELVGNDDLSTKVRLLYKKVIAQFVAELEEGWPAPVPTRGTRSKKLGPSDLEFAEANRTCDSLPPGLRKELKLYREIADACMGLRVTAIGRTSRALANSRPPQGWFTPQTVAKLRALTASYANGCERLNREKIEMVLLALEILLKPGVEPSTEKLAADATRMMAVLGETTKVASHPELSRYFERFQRIALGRGGDPASPSIARKPSREKAAEPRESLLFYLRIAPGLALKLTTEPAEPPQPGESPVLSDPVGSAPSALSQTP
jgi:tetratricopeptide (TPR) repeat protein